MSLKRILAPQFDTEVQALGWSLDRSPGFKYTDLVRLRVPFDGSALIHAALKAFDSTYQAGMISSVPLDRNRLVREYRNQLAQAFDQPYTAEGTLYTALLAGQLPLLARYDPRYQREALIDVLLGSQPLVDWSPPQVRSTLPLRTQALLQQPQPLPPGLTQVYLTLLATMTDRDIYLLDAARQDVVLVCRPIEPTRSRSALILLQLGSHVETVGHQQQGHNSVVTEFALTADLIQALQQRLRQQNSVQPTG